MKTKQNKQKLTNRSKMWEGCVHEDEKVRVNVPLEKV